MSGTSSVQPSSYQQLLSEVTKLHEADQQVSAFVVMEITTQENATDEEIGLLALHTSTDDKMLNKYFGRFAQHKPYLSNNSLKFELDENHSVSLTYVQASAFLMSVRRILQGKELERVVDVVTVGGGIPEALLFDVLHAGVLFDREATFECLYWEFNAYPRDFAFHLISYLTTEIKKKMTTLVSASGFIKEVALVDVKIAALRLLYTLNNEFFPGLTKLKEASTHWDASEKKILETIVGDKESAFTKVVIKLLGRAKNFPTI